MNKLRPILVAEDNPMEIRFFKRAFSQCGIAHHTIFVRDGQEVIDYLSGVAPFNHRLAYPIPALIILDLTRPRVTGFEVLEWIGRDAAFSEIPVLAFSGIQLPADICRAYSLGAKLYLSQTSDPNQKTAVLEQLVKIYGLAHPFGETLAMTPVNPFMALRPSSSCCEVEADRVSFPSG